MSSACGPTADLVAAILCHRRRGVILPALCRVAGLRRPWHHGPVRAGFFDLDDTLCDTAGCRRQRARAALAAVCAERPELNLERLLARALEPAETPREVRGLGVALAEAGLAGTPLADAALRRYVSDHAPLRLFAGVSAVLTRLATVAPLGIVSNAEGWYQREKLTVLGLAPLFRWVVLSGEVGFAKPDPRIFRQALALADVPPADAVFVGDRPEVDIAGARAAGMRAIWFNHWVGVAPAGAARPDATITRFAALPAALAALDAAR